MTNRKNWLRYIRNYRFHSIFWKNLMLVMGVLILPFICILFLSFYAYNNIRDNEIEAYANEEVAKITSQVNNLIDEMKIKAITIGIDKSLELYMYTNEERKKIPLINDICYLLSLYNIAVDEVDSIYIYSMLHNEIISKAGLYPYDVFYDKECIDLIDENDDMYEFKYTDRIVSGKQKRNFSLYYTYTYGAKYVTVIIVNINIEKVKEELDYGNNISIEILKDDEILYSDEFLEDNTEKNEINNIKSLKVTKPLPHDMTLRIKVDTKVLEEDFLLIRKYLIVFTSIMMLLTFIMVFYISKKIFNPIGEILEIFESENLTESDEEGWIQRKDERQEIVNAIYATLDSKKNIEDELVQKVNLMKKAQAVALQSQINPHFLNNTLETVNWLSIRKLGDDNDISLIINSLSSLLRASLESADTFVSLEEEIEYTKTYLIIQQIRYNNCFQVEWDIPDELLQCRILKIVLQPIVENALKYGIKPNKGKGIITIRAQRENQIVKIIIKNSGWGIPQKNVIEINESIHENVIKENKHIGLSNVHQRLVLAFGEKCGLTFSSEIKNGSTVTIIIPYNK